MPPHCLVQGTGSLLCRKTTNAIMSCEKYTILSPREVAERLVGADNEILLVDCRSLVAFNVRHIKGAIHINCSGILRKRLTQGKAKLKDLISSAEGKERFASDCARRTLVVYDELSSGHGCGECGPCRPICLVQETLLKEGRAISVLKGEWKHFFIYAWVPETFVVQSTKGLAYIAATPRFFFWKWCLKSSTQLLLDSLAWFCCF